MPHFDKIIPGRRWDVATMHPRHLAIADEWRGKGYIADKPTTVREDAELPYWIIAVASAFVAGVALGVLIVWPRA